MHVILVVVVVVIVSAGIWHVCQKLFKTFEISHKTFFTPMNISQTHAWNALTYSHTHTVWIYLADCQATQLPLSSLTHDTCSLVRLAN